MEQHLNRELTNKEVVHHLDGNKENNDPSNLLVVDNKTHGKIHATLEYVAFHLYKTGIITFNKDSNTYELGIEDKIQKLKGEIAEIYGAAKPENIRLQIKMNNLHKIKAIEDEIDYLKKLFNL